LLPPAALSSWSDDAGAERVPVWEMERAQVSYRDGRYYMMFSVWEHFMDADWKREITRNKGACSQSAIIVLVSDSVTGPYRFDDSARLLQKPANRNLYGAMVVPGLLPGPPEFAVGWYPDTFTLEVSSDIRVDWEGEAFLDVSSQQP
jgi:beta-fructofuranosidase